MPSCCKVLTGTSDNVGDMHIHLLHFSISACLQSYLEDSVFLSV